MYVIIVRGCQKGVERGFNFLIAEIGEIPVVHSALVLPVLLCVCRSVSARAHMQVFNSSLNRELEVAKGLDVDDVEISRFRHGHDMIIVSYRAYRSTNQYTTVPTSTNQYKSR